MTKSLTQSVYQALLNAITDVYEKAHKRAQATVSIIRMQAYWDIGRMIVQVEQKNRLRAEYGIGLIKSLSRDLSHLGTGFSESNLEYMRRFYVAYPIPQTSGELTWSHYQVLSSIIDDKDRAHYEEETIRHSWSVRDLKGVLRKDHVAFEKMAFPEAGRARTAIASTPALPIKRGRLGLFRVAAGEGGAFALDCGFHIFRDVLIKGVADVVEGDILEAGSAEGTFRRAGASDKELFTYKAVIKNVVDGDTLLCDIACGLNTRTHQRLRLRSLNAPELSTRKGGFVKTFVEDLLLPLPFIVIKTYSTDVYGRYLADVFYLPGEEDASVVASEGILLNQTLLDEGLAVEMV